MPHMTLEELFGSILDLSLSEVSDECSQATTSSWDSMRHLQLLAGIQEVFEVTFATDEIAAIKTLADIRRLLAAKGAPT